VQVRAAARRRWRRSQARQPDAIVVGYQGDGDLAAIGGNEISRRPTAARTTRSSSSTTRSTDDWRPDGADDPAEHEDDDQPAGAAAGEGFPIRVASCLNSLTAPYYLERVALGDNANNRKARRGAQGAAVPGREQGLLAGGDPSPCPTGWKMKPVDAAK
jgi:hypothetical protein